MTDDAHSTDDTEYSIKSLKFASASSTNAAIAAKEGEAAATVRYDDEKEIKAGDRLKLLVQNGDEFGRAFVSDTEKLPAGDAFAYILNSDALYPSDSYDHMMSALNHHYDGGIYAGTKVKVVIFKPELESFVSASENRDDCTVSPETEQ